MSRAAACVVNVSREHFLLGFAERRPRDVRKHDGVVLRELHEILRKLVDAGGNDVDAFGLQRPRQHVAAAGVFDRVDVEDLATSANKRETRRRRC